MKKHLLYLTDNFSKVFFRSKINFLSTFVASRFNPSLITDTRISPPEMPGSPDAAPTRPRRGVCIAAGDQRRKPEQCERLHRICLRCAVRSGSIRIRKWPGLSPSTAVRPAAPPPPSPRDGSQQRRSPEQSTRETTRTKQSEREGTEYDVTGQSTRHGDRAAATAALRSETEATAAATTPRAERPRDNGEL